MDAGFGPNHWSLRDTPHSGMVKWLPVIDGPMSTSLGLYLKDCNLITYAVYVHASTLNT